LSADNIRVLVADDSPTARALLVGILSGSSGIEVIGEATDGVEAVEMTSRLRPDVVTMDVNMPRLDGYAATRRIMVECPTPIVVVSSLDLRSVEASMEALRAGALEVIPKPEGPSSPGHGQQARYLAAIVRAMSDVRLVRQVAAFDSGRRLHAPESVAYGRAPRPRAVAIAASTGGPIAIQRILSELPTDFGAPILFVQHMAVGFGEGFAAWLGASVELRVKIARTGEPLEPGTAYLAPDERHLGVSVRGTTLLSDAAPIQGFRPSANFLFESVGKSFGAASVGVILTGMGSDGLEGMRSLAAAGGRVIAQDEQSSEIFGMPGAVVDAGLAQQILPLHEIAAELVAICR
jgi:two-component system chemotaxis response regulator CheB